MPIILDAQSLTEKSTLGYLEINLFTALACALKEQKFVYPDGCSASLETIPENMTAVEFPSRSGLFQKRKWDKWLQNLNPTVYIGFNRSIKTTYPLKQILLLQSIRDVLPESNDKTIHAVGFTSTFLKDHFSENLAKTPFQSLLIEGIVKNNKLSNTEIDWQEIKDRFCDGCEYFISTDFFESKEQFILLLKALSGFKRMQQSSWKLMIVLRAANGFTPDEANTLLSNYKYREDVVLTSEDDLCSKLACAYALITANEKEVFPVSVVEAINIGTPVIAIPTQTIRMMFANAIVYTAGNTHEAMTEMLMMMYKGETYRKSIINGIEDYRNQYNIDNALKPLLQCIQQLRG